MIALNENSRKTRWFAFCTKLPFSNGLGKMRSFSSYRETGTTLCHFVWVTVWNPLWWTLVLYYVGWHIVLRPFWEVYLQKGLFAAIVPLLWLLMVLVGLALGVTVIAFFVWLLEHKASSQTNLVVAYAKALKNKVCPLVKFEPGEPK